MKAFLLKYILEDSISSFKNQKYLNILSLITIIFTFFIINIFFFLNYNISDFIKKFASNYEAEIYLYNDSKTGFNFERLNNKELIKEYRVISSQEAMKIFLKNFPSLKPTIKEIGENPFPPSIKIIFKSENKNEINSFLNKIKGYKEVKDIKTNFELIEKISGIKKIILLLGLFFGSILLFTSFFTIVNIIKIVAYSRKEDVLILRMIGASNFYIEAPLILNGIFLGILGALISIGLFEISVRILPLYLKSFYQYLRPILEISSLSLKYYLYLLLSATLIGGFSSYTSVYKFIHIEEE